MARIRDILEAAPAVGNFLVLGQGIGDQRKRPLIGLEGLGQSFGRRLALQTIAVLQQIERRLDRKLLGRHLEAQRRDGLVEQPVPGGVAALGFFVKQLLDAVLQLIRLVLAQILDPRPVMCELRRVCIAFSITASSMRLSSSAKNNRCTEAVGQPFGDIAVEFRDRGIDAVAGMNQSGIGAEPAGEIVDRLIALYGSRKPAATALSRRPLRKLAFVVGLKRDAFGIHPVEVVRHFRRVDRRNRGRPGSIPAACPLSTRRLSWNWSCVAEVDLRRAEAVARGHLVRNLYSIITAGGQGLSRR